MKWCEAQAWASSRRSEFLVAPRARRLTTVTTHPRQSPRQQTNLNNALLIYSSSNKITIVEQTYSSHFKFWEIFDVAIKFKINSSLIYYLIKY